MENKILYYYKLLYRVIKSDIEGLNSLRTIMFMVKNSLTTPFVILYLFGVPEIIELLLSVILSVLFLVYLLKLLKINGFNQHLTDLKGKDYLILSVVEIIGMCTFILFVIEMVE
jgi:hypothetical protein